MIPDPTVDDAPARLFFALYPDPAAAAAMAAIGEDVRARHGLRGGGVRPERLHATVAYLGTFDALPVALVAAAKVAADRIESDAVPVEFDTIASFENRRGVYPLVLRGCDNGPLRTLHHALVESLSATRAIAAAEPFEPHVTLMRSRTLLPAEAVAPVRWTARELVLVHSVVGRGRYLLLHRRALGAEPVE